MTTPTIPAWPARYPTAPKNNRSPEYFDTTPTANELHTLQTPPTEAAAKPKEEVEIPGAIFSYPILRQKGEPILDEEPPVRGPHTPLLPNLDTDADEEDDAPLTAHAAPAQPAPQPAAPAAGTPAKVTASGRAAKGCSRPACPAPQAGGRIKPETNRTISAPHVWNCAVLPK